MDECENKRRNIFVGLFIASATAMLGMGIILPILPQYAESLGASGVMIGIIFAGYAISRGIFAPLIGQISDAYGRKRLIALGLALNFLLSLGYVIAFNPLVLTVVRTAQGIASAMITPLAQSYIGDIVPEGKEGEYMNLFYISFFGGTAIGPVVGGYLSGFSLEFPFYTMAGVTLAALILVIFLVPESPVKDIELEINFQRSFLKVIAENRMRGLMFYVCSRGFYRWGFNSFFPIYAIQLASLNNFEVGLILSGYMAIGGILQYPFGRLTDRYPEYQEKFIFLGGLISAAFMFLIPFFKSVAVLILLTVGMGASSAFARSAMIVIRTKLGNSLGMGNVVGTTTMSMSLGQVLGPLVFGAIVDCFEIQTAFYFGGIVGFLGIFMTYYCFNPDKVRPALKN